jgi:hypothetical protein
MIQNLNRFDDLRLRVKEERDLLIEHLKNVSLVRLRPLVRNIILDLHLLVEHLKNVSLVRLHRLVIILDLHLLVD